MFFISNRSRLLAVIAACWIPTAAVCQVASVPSGVEWAKSNLDDLIGLYRHLHAHPELSFAELQTAARIADEWRALGFDVTTQVGGHGVVAILRNGDGPTLMLRADMDALPIAEETNLAFASRVTAAGKGGVEVPVMHACGHDVHMTNLVGVARFLVDSKDTWSGTLMLVAQPAEERGAGARAMLDDGLFRRFPKPDFAMALHVSPELPAGCVGYRIGYTLANVDSVDITVKGRGGHGAAPHLAIDPVVQAAQLVVSLQTIVSRELNPIDPAVITVGSIHGGTKHNVIGDTCQLQLTVRSYSDEVRRHLLDAIRRKAKAVAAGDNAPEPDIEISEGTPSLSNDQDLVERVVPVFREVVGPERVIETPPAMAGEDFSQFGRAGVPIFMFWLGTADPKSLGRMKELGQQPPSLHSSRYFPEVEPALVTGIGCMAAAAIHLLGK